LSNKQLLKEKLINQYTSVKKEIHLTEKKEILDHKSRQGFEYSNWIDLNSPVKIKVKGDPEADFNLTTELFNPVTRQWEQVSETTDRVHVCDTVGRVRFGLNVPVRAVLGIVEVENA
jgi:hypothetical protein